MPSAVCCHLSLSKDRHPARDEIKAGPELKRSQLTRAALRRFARAKPRGCRGGRVESRAEMIVSFALNLTNHQKTTQI